MFWMLDHHQQVVEPSGVAAVAGGIRYAGELAGRRTAVVVTGGNISGERYRSLIGTFCFHVRQTFDFYSLQS